MSKIYRLLVVLSLGVFLFAQSPVAFGQQKILRRTKVDEILEKNRMEVVKGFQAIDEQQAQVRQEKAAGTIVLLGGVGALSLASVVCFTLAIIKYVQQPKQSKKPRYAARPQSKEVFQAPGLST